ncbi:hypothetical protein AB0F11_23255 [Streptomyces sp. NPDC032472]|uniref:hypothetical protein n=1 Tax=Streptomyces sp. NPDC032472 TaxID=3155018 RepID=UPI0033D2803C
MAVGDEAGGEAQEGFVDVVASFPSPTTRRANSPLPGPEITKARTDVFLAALELHRAFLRCTARPMYANLTAAMDAVTGAVPKTVPRGASAGGLAEPGWRCCFCRDRPESAVPP